MPNVKDIELAISQLSQTEYQELRDWLDRKDNEPVETHLQSVLDSGEFDGLIQDALDDHKAGRTRPL